MSGSPLALLQARCAAARMAELLVLLALPLTQPSEASKAMLKSVNSWTEVSKLVMTQSIHFGTLNSTPATERISRLQSYHLTGAC